VKRLICLACIAALSGCVLRDGSRGIAGADRPLPPERLVIAYAPDWEGLEGILDGVEKGLLTHVNVAFLNPLPDGSLPEIKDAAALIERAHGMGADVFLSVGGGGTSTEGKLARQWRKIMSGKARDAFAAAVVAYAAERGYDGIDLDVEGAGIGPGYARFVLALDAARQEPPGGGKRLWLTAALPGDLDDPDVTKAAWEAFDWINVMAYDLTGPWDPENPGPHSPYAYAESSLRRYAEMGLPSERLVLGIPLYGYRFGPGKEKRHFGWDEIVRDFPESAAMDEIRLPGSRGTVYFNGKETVRAKAVLARSSARGIMFWQIGQDARGAESLIKAGAEALKD